VQAKYNLFWYYKEFKKYQRTEPTNADWGLFGLNTIKKSDKVVVLTEGEFDAMAVHEATGIFFK
jgi:twinkle protein